MACNFGATTGASFEDLIGIFSESNFAVERVAIKEGKSYSFVSFKDASTASDAWKALHGKDIEIGNHCIYYVTYKN